MAFLNEAGLATFLSYLKAWARAAFASKTDTQTIEGSTTFSQLIIGNVAGNCSGSSGSCTGNAGTATKLKTARAISAGDLEFQGSASFDGSGDVKLNVTNHRCIVSVGNTNNYPFHRIAYVPLYTGSWNDRGITFLVSKDYHGGGYGIARIIFRTNNTASQEAQCSIQWLCRTSDIAVNAIQVGFVKTAGASYLDVFYHSGGAYNSAVCRVLAHANARNGVGRGFTVVDASTEVSGTTATDPKTSVESYKTIADAGTALHNQAYTDIIAASDVGVTGQAGKLSSSRTISLTGDVSGSASFDGSANASITATIADDSHNHVISNVDGLQSALDAKADDSAVVHLAGTEIVTGTKTFSSEVNISAANALRMKSSSYGAFFRNDNSSFYLLVTASGDADGTWTTARPLTVNLATGVCNINGNAATATKVAGTAANDTVAELVRGTMGSNDAFRIAIGGGNNAGWAEIATADDYNEPIYVRQYQGGFTTLKRTATLLDGSGNTSFPGTVAANAFSGPLTGNVTGNCSGSSGSCTGNSATATKFASAQSVALTGDVTGSASSQAGWSIATTLANSGVTAGRYTSVNVDAKGRVTAGNVKHSYTVAKSAAKNWYRLANANTSQTDASKTLHAQFIVTAYNTGQDTGYYERWFVDCEVFGINAGIRIFGNTSAPFSQARVLYENTIADIDANDRPAIDLYLNYVMNNAATTVTVEEVCNSGWTFVADGQLAASTVPSGFENVACSVRNNGVERCTYADYVPYLNRQISNFTAAFTLADSYLYRSRTLNCTGTFTITIPSINSGYMWCVIKNKNTSSGVITLHPSTTSVLIDGSNADITLQPMEYVCIHSAGANNYSLIADGRWKSKKADKATTLAGYGITDAKIENGVITLGSNTITPLTSHQSLDNYVTLNGAETISGGKTFSSVTTFNNQIVFNTSDTIRKNSNDGVMRILGGSNSSSNPYLAVSGSSRNLDPGCFIFRAINSTQNKGMVGSPSGTLTWDGQDIQISSDERIKTPLASVPNEVLDAWGEVQWGQFQYLEAVEAKGAEARLHLGLIAQRVKDAFDAKGLDACAYGILCHEQKEAVEDEPAVDLWMVRYAEAQAMEAAFQRRRADRLEARIAVLEERING